MALRYPVVVGIKSALKGGLTHQQVGQPKTGAETRGPGPQGCQPKPAPPIPSTPRS